MKIQLLAYDIPETSDLANPSGELHRRGIRINLSCWAIPDSRIPWNLLHELTAGGATWYLVAFDQNEEVKICGMVVDSLRRELAQAEKAAEHAERKAREALPGTHPTEEAKEYRRKALAAVSLAMRRFRAAEECAAGFKEDRIVSEFEQTRRRMTVLRARVEQQAKTYAEMTDALSALPGEHAAGIHAAAVADDLPAEIGGDYLVEQCDDARAAELQQQIARAFGQ